MSSTIYNGDGGSPQIVYTAAAPESGGVIYTGAVTNDTSIIACDSFQVIYTDAPDGDGSVIYSELVTGIDGLTAYQIAVRNGFTGNEMQWLTSLFGRSAYMVAVDNGFVGTEMEWLASLQGRSAYQTALDFGFVGTEQEWMQSLVSINLGVTLADAGKFLFTDGFTHSWQTINKETVGLGNVDNTSDINKPISTATQAALDDKVPYSEYTDLFIANINDDSIVMNQGELEG